MSFDLSIERRIDAAVKEGLFDNLPNAGERLDLEEYFAWPEHLRMAYSILKSAHCAPEEVELMREIQQLAARSEKSLSGEELKRLRDLRLNLAIRLEHFRTSQK
jgi:DnaJ-like protein